eukprot:CAMPEP_0168725154 /NCGR_PEP_ID=MMETSP0724-20121128/4005_1 /TAXON_ID=265536 /ORGANISM="Amphiprora sp., Strain CCMP467" /LENGTH=1133 /DNA_ID=CAMNT_0008771925 /DNA_START=336 /DNA_END=3737 /DNA_ORIENTATION=-
MTEAQETTATNMNQTDSATLSLDFKQLGIFGRDGERRALQTALQRVQKNRQTHVAWVEGDSGSGKSSLVFSSLEQQLQEGNENNCFVVSGTFDMPHNHHDDISNSSNGSRNSISDQQSSSASHSRRGFETDISSDGKLQQTFLYQGLRGALGQLCQQILSLPSSSSSPGDSSPLTLEAAKAALSMGLDHSSWKVLDMLIPNLFSILGGGGDAASADEISSISNETGGKNESLEGQNFKELADRFKLASRQFVQSVSNFLPCIVLVFENLQWADHSSLDLLSSWINDSENGSLMIVGCYRSDVPANAALTEMIATYEHDSRVSVQKIILHNLGISEIEDMLDKLLSASDLTANVMLADLIFQKTHGNVLFVVQLLQFLSKKQLFQPRGDHWEWDQSSIARQCEPIQSISDLMQLSLAQVEVARNILPIAACLGSAFGASMLFRVLDNMNDFQNSPADLRAMEQQLQVCVSEGFLESDKDEGRYKFVNHQIRLAALKLVEESGEVQLKFEVGEALLSSCDPEEMDDIIFLSLELVNPYAVRLKPLDPARMKIARLNEKAASTAMKTSSFKIASWYYRRAISLLPHGNSRWKGNHYNRTLRMYRAAVVAESLNGDERAMFRYVDRVREHGHDIYDKIQVYHVLMDWFVDHGRAEESVDLGIRVLNQMGASIPSNDIVVAGSTITGLLKTRSMMAKHLEEGIDRLPVVHDYKFLALMKTIDNLGTACYFVRQNLVPIIIFKGVRKTFKIGVTPYSAVFMAGYAFAMMAHLGDFGVGKKCADLALTLLKKHKTKDFCSKVKMITYGLSLHFVTPLESLVDRLQESYLDGLQSGDFESSLFSSVLHTQALLAMGRTLRFIEKNCATYINVFQDIRDKHIVEVHNAARQACLNLMGEGKNKNTTLLVGSAMNQDKVIEMYSGLQNNLVLRDSMRYLQMNNAVFFGDFKYGAEMAVRFGEQMHKTLQGNIITTVIQFNSAYCCFRMAQDLSQPAGIRKKYLAHALIVHKRIKDWVSKGNPNCRHYCALLDAELAMLKGSSSVTVQYCLDEALAFANKDGLIHIEALIMERYATFHKTEQNGNDFRLRAMSALTLYQEWGALAVVEKLKQEWKHDLGKILEELPTSTEGGVVNLDMSIQSWQ